MKMILNSAGEVFAPVINVSELSNILLNYLNNNFIIKEEGVVYFQKGYNLIDQFIGMNEYHMEIMFLAFDNHLSYYAEYLFLSLALNGKLYSRDKKLNKAAEQFGIKY